MWVLAGIFTLTLVKISLAGSANYLGGDIEAYAELSKKSTLYPRSAIQAVQARAVIAQKRLTAYKKSQVPKPKGNVLDVIGAEKSLIPHPSQYLAVNKRSAPSKENGFHRDTPSIMLSEERRAEISRLNAAALHRNAYMDSTGGVSYGGMGGVLSRQGWRYEKKHRRDIPEFVLRQRRSHMPYLGQNLEQLGVIRVKPNWDSKVDKKDQVPEVRTPQKVGEKASLQTAAIFDKQENPFQRNNIAQLMQPWQQQQQRSNIPAFNPYFGQQQMMYPNPYAALMFPQQPMVNNMMAPQLPEALNTKTK